MYVEEGLVIYKGLDSSSQWRLVLFTACSLRYSALICVISFDSVWLYSTIDDSCLLDNNCCENQILLWTLQRFKVPLSTTKSRLGLQRADP